MPSKPRDTKLTRELATAKLPSGTGQGVVAVERLHVKKAERVEIRGDSSATAVAPGGSRLLAEGFV